MPHNLGRRAALCLAICIAAPAGGAERAEDFIEVDTAAEPMAEGRFEPTWESLEQYQTPEWFRDAKFGIWAHWGPQCQPERGDWYARHMYSQGHWQNRSHVENYGHPSEFGFKDVIHSWKAEDWNPRELVALYKRAGAKYFFAMANHHDNLDMWDSKHQPWNSVAVGPQTDLIGGWAEAARAEGLRLGLSFHAVHAWLWYETAQGADNEGNKKGVPYDGKLTKEDGAGTWWEGLDPQDLYAQDHEPSEGFQDTGRIHGRWHWTGDGSKPDRAYCENMYNRSIDMINRFRPDLVYFDDTALPLWPISDAGLKIAAHYYNANEKWHDGRQEAVLFGKILTEQQQRCMVWDIEKGHTNDITEQPWQSCTCLGGWHYDRGIYDRGRYKSARQVVHMLIDIVSKNGNLLLNVPVRGDGSIDEKERAIVEEIADWMDVNGEAIYATRPWDVYGEGPKMAENNAMRGQGFNEGKGKPFTAQDFRFTRSKDGKTLYVFVMGEPEGEVRIEALKATTGRSAGPIRSVRMLGSEEAITHERNADALVLSVPAELPSEHAVAYVVEME